MIYVTVSKDGSVLRSFAIGSDMSEDMDLDGLLDLLDEQLVGHRVVKNNIYTAGERDGENILEFIHG